MISTRIGEVLSLNSSKLRSFGSCFFSKNTLKSRYFNFKIIPGGIDIENSRKADLEKQVIVGAREYGISITLFRHAVGEILGVNVTDMECLGLIFFKGLATPSEVARYTGLSSGATTAMLDRLEKSGLIERHPNLQDRRSIHIVIAKEKAEEVAPLFASVRNAQETLVASFTESELELLSDYFRRSITIWEEAREKIQKDTEGKQ